MNSESIKYEKEHIMQSKINSLIECLVNIVIGSGISMLLLHLFFPDIPLYQNATIIIVFTIASIIRQYIIRRFFVWIEGRKKKRNRLWA